MGGRVEPTVLPQQLFSTHLSNRKYLDSTIFEATLKYPSVRICNDFIKCYKNLFLSCKNQSVDLQCKSKEWFAFDTNKLS